MYPPYSPIYCCRMTSSLSTARRVYCTRRQLLIGAGSVALVGGVGRASAADQEVTPTVIIPAVDEFENNYVGQFLTIRSQSLSEGEDQAVTDACTELPWPEENMVQRAGQLTDRRSNEPIAVRLPVFLNEDERPEQDDALYMISQANTCDGDYVEIQLSPVDLRNITGGGGPDVTEGGDDGGGSGLSAQDGSGFGLFAGTVGGIGALLARLFVDRDSPED